MHSEHSPAPSGPAPDACEPGLSFTRQASRPVEMLQLGKTGRHDMRPPGRPVIPDAVALATPALLVIAARIGAEEHATGLQCGPELGQHTRQLLAGHMEQHGIGEDAVESLRRELQLVEILVPDLAAALPGHRDEGLAAI